MIIYFCYVFLLLIVCTTKIIFEFIFYLLIGLIIQYLVYNILDFSIYNNLKEIFINFNKKLDLLY